MTSGKNHDRITWLCLPWIFIGTIIASKDLLTGFVVASGFLFSGLMFGPDLDIYSVQFKRWGYFKFIWLPYQKYLPHRSFFSHGFIIGTVIRSLYLCFILLLVGLILGAIALMISPEIWQDTVNNLAVIGQVYLKEIIALFIGLELGAMSHYLADIIDSWLKKRQKKKTTRKPKRRIKKTTAKKPSAKRKVNRR
ncbi:metal-binding protein [Cyanobacterium stanieri LEGE 03274]|uniref:Metal-binding protein n=1 Tax=Cyanobacterium stanieri LEGE 03274 TaxID=1828756 RepID=A0ABR9V9R3_9CHRO|nr:metal-binding protein [Cyanobacterium stanieri]MBE9223594.1 metal-binding protein [Cyanobacterium stanieri LEGE 03274]